MAINLLLWAVQYIFILRVRYQSFKRTYILSNRSNNGILLLSALISPSNIIIDSILIYLPFLQILKILEIPYKALNICYIIAVFYFLHILPILIHILSYPHYVFLSLFQLGDLFFVSLNNILAISHISFVILCTFDLM